MSAIPSEWEVVIGMEIHVELNTKSKLFSSAPNKFNCPPNENVSPVCTGMPGALPVLNKEAVRKAVQFGCAIDAQVPLFSKFDRKSYFYPDSPRNFQITQFDEPIIVGGHVKTEVDGKEISFEIDRAHLEDDAGMLKHFPDYAAIDYNRAGVPLLEIVSTPCIRSGKEAVAYGSAVKMIMEYIGASDCNMEEGSLRMDCNVSVRKKGEKGLRNKVEIKNMNSFSFMEKAILSEATRQIKAYRRNPDAPQHELVPQATYRWDEERQETVLMRSKEEADDYRYFPEPDLPPIVLEASYIEEIRKQLPELPFPRYKRYVDAFGLSHEGAQILTSEIALGDFFEEALKYCSNPKSLCSWITVEFAGRCKELSTTLLRSGIQAKSLGDLIAMIDQGKITGKIAKKVADEMLRNPQVNSAEIVAKNPDFQPMQDDGALEGIIRTVLESNPESVEDYKAGKEKALSFLMGQVMKATKGKASPQKAKELLEKIMEE